MAVQRFDRETLPVGYRGKRAFDILASVLTLLLVSPLLLLLWISIRILAGSPVLFRQRRPGLGGREFKIFKFRTMIDRRNADGQLLPNGERLTRIGSFLRRTSLDELPELWNVLRGDMSFVGPRPLLMEYLSHYSPRESLRHNAKPGITGLAQISGRNYLDWTERLEFDVTYVRNISFRLDLGILYRTIRVVMGREGVSADTDQVETRLDEERTGDRRAEHYKERNGQTPYQQ